MKLLQDSSQQLHIDTEKLRKHTRPLYTHKIFLHPWFKKPVKFKQSKVDNANKKQYVMENSWSKQSFKSDERRMPQTVTDASKV